jgi:septation ring formation regulator EzrA
MKVSELKTEMDSLFAAVNERFEQVDRRFEQVDRRFEQVDQRFERIDERFERVDRTLEELRQLMKSEGEATRRHFDVVAEKMVAARNLALDRSMATAQQLVSLTASNATEHVQFARRLDDHDRRLENIEKGRSADPDQA